MKIVIFFFCLFFALNSYGQESTFLDYDYVCELSRTYIKPTTHAKRLRLSSRCGGCIDLDISDCKGMPDSLFVAITKVKEVWENYLPFGASVNVKIRYVDLGDTDIKTSVDHDLMLEDNLYYPSCLYRKLVNQSVEKKEGSRKIDALISINSKTNWAVGFTKSDIPNKNLAYSLLKQFAVVLGFGTSIKCDKRGAFNFGFTRGQSVFDSYLFTEDGAYLKNIANTERAKLAKFIKQANGYVYFERKNENRKIYAPSTFDELNSLKTLVVDGSLMSKNNKEVNDLVVDSVTLNILRTIGWDFTVNSPIKIVGENIDESGIASAYRDHKFSVISSAGNITSPLWECRMPLKNGDIEVINSTDLLFLLPAIKDDKYKHTKDGDIVAKISFQGKINGKVVDSNYNLTLELKPSVLKAEVVEARRNEDYPDYFDIDVDVYYEGSYYLDAYVEEEYSSMLNSYFSDTPYYTRLHLKDVDSYGKAALHITINNQYGTNKFVIDNLFDHIHGQNSEQKIVNKISDKVSKSKTSRIKIGGTKMVVTKVFDKSGIVVKKVIEK